MRERLLQDVSFGLQVDGPVAVLTGNWKIAEVTFILK